MTDAKISEDFREATAKIVSQIGDDLTQVIGEPVRISTDGELMETATIHPGDGGRGIVCARTTFVRHGNGIGGILLSEHVANRFGHAMMMMDPPEPTAAIDWGGLVRESMDEVFNLVVGAWNNSCPADYRLGSSVEERSVEYYGPGVDFPQEAGVAPIVLEFDLELGEYKGRIAFILPITAVHGKVLAGFAPPEVFTHDPPGSGFPAETDPAALSGGVPARREGPARPVVFVDYTGEILKWIRERAADENIATIQSGGGETTETPAATVVVGVDPAQLDELNEYPHVEFRWR